MYLSSELEVMLVPQKDLLLGRWEYFEEIYQRTCDGKPREIFEKRVFGDRQLVFCAPHATELFARGRLKPAEARTGSLADLMAEYFGGVSLKTIGYPLSTAGLRDEVSTLPSEYIFIDLHGMRDVYGIDLCVGLGPQPNVLCNRIGGALLHLSESNSLKCSVNEPFAATSPHTLTRLVQSQKGVALQVELSHECRDFKNRNKNLQVIHTLIGALKRFIP
jgi:hypothetical protein